MKIARVFARKTAACPDDILSFFSEPTRLFPPEVDEVHVSCTFREDRKHAENLAKAWEVIAPVKIGGPAYDDFGGEFEIGKYIKKGYVITSRGCPEKCWFCLVPKREGNIRELKIKEGWNLLDNNILACSDGHIKTVFKMLGRQERRAEFTGGIEPARLKSWHVDLMKKLNPKRMYFAYDGVEDEEPMSAASKIISPAFPFSTRVLSCYVLIGFKGDTIAAAEKRLKQTIKWGFFPFAMLYNKKTQPQEWKRFQRNWVRPEIIATMAKAVA